MGTADYAETVDFYLADCRRRSCDPPSCPRRSSRTTRSRPLPHRRRQLRVEQDSQAHAGNASPFTPPPSDQRPRAATPSTGRARPALPAARRARPSGAPGRGPGRRRGPANSRPPLTSVHGSNPIVGSALAAVFLGQRSAESGQMGSDPVLRASRATANGSVSSRVCVDRTDCSMSRSDGDAL